MGYYQAWLEDFLYQNQDVEAGVIVGGDGKPMAHANIGIAEEMVIAGVCFAVFGASITLSFDFSQGDVNIVLFRLHDAQMIVFPIEPDILLVAIFRPGKSAAKFFLPDRLRGDAGTIAY